MPSSSDRKKQEREVAEYLKQRAAELDEANNVNRSRGIATNAARDRLFLNQLEASLEKLLTKKYVVGKDYRPRTHLKTCRVLNLVLSDLHFGAALDKREVPLQYSHVEEARRLAAVVLQTAEYKLDHRAETELYIHLLGDVIQNQLHDPRDGAPLAEQMASAIHLLTQAVVFLAGQFKQVTVYCATGNHGRNTSRHAERAVCQKWDSNETVIYFAVKTAVANISNVKINIPRTPYYTCKALGMSIFGTHGDTVLKPGFPNRAIKVGEAQKQIDSINGKLAFDHRHRLFLVGHVHNSSCTTLPNGVIFISNGCLIPTDSYAGSIGITDTACRQILFETVPGIIVGDHRAIILDETVDCNKDLDRIIQPFVEF